MKKNNFLRFLKNMSSYLRSEIDNVATHLQFFKKKVSSFSKIKDHEKSVEMKNKCRDLWDFANSKENFTDVEVGEMKKIIDEVDAALFSTSVPTPRKTLAREISIERFFSNPLGKKITNKKDHLEMLKKNFYIKK